jgi:hypothetical protein
MIKEINTPSGPQTLLLGYEVIRFLSKPVKEDTNELDQIESAALIGFNVWNRRQGNPEITKDQMILWFDEIDTYTDVINAVKDFMLNFTQRVSDQEPTPTESKKKK